MGDTYIHKHSYKGNNKNLIYSPNGYLDADYTVYEYSIHVNSEQDSCIYFFLKVRNNAMYYVSKTTQQFNAVLW